MAVEPDVVVVPERLVAGGDALAHLDDGRVAFVSGALPGETVRLEVTERRRDFVRGRVTDVVRAAAGRVEPPCPHRRAGCGGCGWMHLDPTSQLQAKVEIVVESLRRIGRIDRSEIRRIVEPFGSVSPTGYRTTIRVAGTPDHRPGFRQEHSDRVVAIDSCLVAHPTIAAALHGVRVAPGTELTLRTSVATGELTALWSRATPRSRRRSGRRRGQRREPAVHGLPESTRTGRDASLVERIDGADLRVSTRSFFQSGAEAAELLVRAVDAALPDRGTLRHGIDAYGGVGLFSATVLREVEHVTLIDASRSACADARVNLAERSASVVCRDVARWTSQAEGPPIDVVIADPARSGLGRAGAEALAATSPAPLVLVSCDPVSLARDAALLAERGYRPERVAVLDLAPQTFHVETVTRFVHRDASDSSS